MAQVSDLDCGCFFFLFLLLSVGFLETANAQLPSIEFEPDDPHLAYIGRFDFTNPKRVRFDWSGVQITFQFKGQELQLLLEDERNNGIGKQNTFNIFIDGTLTQILNITFSQKKYTVATGLKDEQHSVLITKRTEALFGISAFSGLIVSGSAPQLLHPPDRPTRKLEFIGASITCGYGDEGVYPCQFTAATENSYYSWGPQLSRELNADYFIEAWSGKGVVRNNADPNVTSKDPFPYYYPRTLANDDSLQWDFNRFIPDAILINLGTNDYGSQPYPPKDVFEGGYQKFINYLRQNYPRQPIFVTCGPMIGDPCCQYVADMAKNPNTYYVDVQHILKFPDDYGCDGHPNVKGQYKITQVVLPVAKKVLGW
jgi:lysophospholipase L1-like esterase